MLSDACEKNIILEKKLNSKLDEPKCRNVNDDGFFMIIMTSIFLQESTDSRDIEPRPY